MSINEWYEEECELCGTYHNKFYICPSCLIGYAVKAGADKDKLIQILNERLENICGIDSCDLEGAVEGAEHIIRG